VEVVDIAEFVSDLRLELPFVGFVGFLDVFQQVGADLTAAGQKSCRREQANREGTIHGEILENGDRIN
jgi:hypothetical protein